MDKLSLVAGLLPHSAFKLGFTIRRHYQNGGVPHIVGHPEPYPRGRFNLMAPDGDVSA